MLGAMLLRIRVFTILFGYFFFLTNNELNGLFVLRNKKTKFEIKPCGYATQPFTMRNDDFAMRNLQYPKGPKPVICERPG